MRESEPKEMSFVGLGIHNPSAERSESFLNREVGPMDSSADTIIQLQAPRTLDCLTDEIKLYKHLAEAKDTKAFLRRVHNLLHRINITEFSHILLRSGEDVQNIWIYPKKEHEELALYPRDIMIQHSLRSDKPIYQHQIKDHIDNAPYDTEEFELNRKIHRMVASFRLYDYWNQAFDSRCGEGRAIFSVGTKDAPPKEFAELVQKNEHVLKSIARAIDHVGGGSFDLHSTFDKDDDAHTRLPKIHSKPLELLSVLANENLTLNDAATRLNITISAANQRMAAVKQALGANTTAAAIILAAKLGLIKVDI